MNKHGFALICILLILIVLVSCQEVFEPRIKADAQYMVVDGMITNSYGPHTVRIFYTKPFGDPYPGNPISNATVSIIDSNGNITSLVEKAMGIYETPDVFKGEVDVEYILEIVTIDGMHFQSRAQAIPRPIFLDSLYVTRGNEPYFYVSEFTGRIVKVDMDVFNVFAVASSHDGSFPRFRFTSEVYLQYNKSLDQANLNVPEIVNKSGAVEAASDLIYYCWVKRNIVDFLGTDIGEFTIPYEARSHRVAMVPRGQHPMRFMNFPFGQYTDLRVVFNRFFSLNDDAYEFHRKKNEQLRGQGGLFDPVVTQIHGNIKCISDPSIPVLGFFEVSYDLGIFIHRIHETTNIHSIELRPINYFEPYQPSHCILYEPDFWIY
jgi:hypothetical protein